MKDNEEKYYTTGEFAKYFGIKKDTLFYYDKLKLFCPAIVKENGYRFYSSSQIDLFRILLSFRKLNLPIKTLQNYFQNTSPEHLLKLVSLQLNRIDDEIEKLLEIKQILTTIKNSTMEAQSAICEKVTIQSLPTKYLLYSKYFKNNIKTTSQQWLKTYEEFLISEKLPNSTYIGSVISKNDINKNNFLRVDRLFTETTNNKGEIRESGLYAVYYHKGNYDSIALIYPFLLSEIQRLGYIVIGDSYEEYLITEIATKFTSQFITRIVIKVSPI